MNVNIEASDLAWGAGIFSLAAILCAMLIVLLRPILLRHAMAKLTGRSSHRIPTPQGGGIAVVGTTLGVSLITILGSQALGPTVAAQLAPIFAAAVLVAAVGAIDDMRTINIAPRLLLQAVAVAIVVWALPAELRTIAALPWWIERALLFMVGLWFVNLTNFMDGIDWMSVAETVPLTGGLVLIGLIGGLPLSGIIVALVLCGAMIGFAPFNRPVARLFLGDVGSLPIGLLLGWLLVLLAGSGHLAAALLLPLYYLADATLTLSRRVMRGERFWEAHRSHFYQRATDADWSVPQVVARVFAVNLALVAMAVATVAVPHPAVIGSCLAAGALLVAGLLWTMVRGKNAAS